MKDKKLPLRSEDLHPDLDYDHLLRLIEQGDPEKILSDKNSNGFNKLMKYELIVLKDDKICLTEKGKEAKKFGVQVVIAPMKFKAMLEDFGSDKPASGRKNYIILLLMLISVLVLLFILFKLNR